MRDAYIVKKSVKRNPIKPTEMIPYEEFQLLVTNSSKLTWAEETKHGKIWAERYPNKPKRLRSYLNIDESDEKSFVQVMFSKSGYIRIQFDFKSTKENLKDLIKLANSIDCNLWQYKPKRQILTHEIVNNRYKPTKPRSKPQTELNVPNIWIKIVGEFETFLKVFKPELEKQNATIARINNNNCTNNKFLIIKVSKGNFYITGKGIKYLYEKEFHPEKSTEFKNKFKYQLNSIFNEVFHNDDEKKLKRIKLENNLMGILNERLETKAEIIIAKVQKRLF